MPMLPAPRRATRLRRRARRSPAILPLLLPLLLLPLAACEAPEAPRLEGDELAALSPGWHAIRPGGETRCSDGSPYRFNVRRGDPQKLLVYLQGGGACWSWQTCNAGDDAPYDPVVDARDDPSRLGGIFDTTRAENPFGDYTMVFVPYCTGDVHLGRTVSRYDGPGGAQRAIHHAGYTNARAALEWAFHNVLAPETVFVTGGSAGAIPSPLYAAFAARRYEGARVVQLGDGGGGYRFAPGMLPRLMDTWGAHAAAEELLGDAALPPEGVGQPGAYTAAATRAQPDVTFAAIDSAEDEVQRYFLSLLNGQAPPSLLPFLQANYDEVRASGARFHTYVAGGAVHTILGRPAFYTEASGGVRLRDWVAALAAGEPAGDVACDACAPAEPVAEPVAAR